LYASFCLLVITIVVPLTYRLTLLQHGHHFYVLTVQKAGFGWGSYNPFEDLIPPGLEDSTSPGLLTNMSLNDSGLSQSTAQPFDLARATYRDTVQIPSRGYAILRFRADNPGVWLLHCHVAWHAATGMAMLLDVQSDPAGLTAHDGSLVSLPKGGICSVP
jgi:FtsP/CotA-like multicopper oxidase with cupredoxin domain